MSDNLFLKSLALGGYRSFGDIQRFEHFKKINLFIGKNNSGKSNALRFIHETLPKLAANQNAGLGQLDRHIPFGKDFIYGMAYESDELIELIQRKLTKNHEETLKYIMRLVEIKSAIEKSDDAWFYFNENNNLETSTLRQAISQLSDQQTRTIWLGTSNFTSGGSRAGDWEPHILNNLFPRFSLHLKVEFIPAIREITNVVAENAHSGEGLILQLAKLQSPDVHSQIDKKRFDAINEFLREVTDNQTASIDIPHHRETINVSMNGRVLPLENLGTGIHEVMILATASTTIQNSVICMEEPELHLNPILQKKLIRYLQEKTNNQYMISTHSASLMDTPDIEIYHVQLVNNESVVDRVSSDKQKTEICEDLGYHPSDLLQSNCVIWVEGPSDRIYLNYWISAVDEALIEGIHYSIMFYGGKLLSHLSGVNEEQVNEFISLRRLNRRGVILIDSDRAEKGKQINSTKRRVKREFDDGPGFAWITQGREIENYLDVGKVKNAINKVSPKAELISSFGTYDNYLSIETGGEKKQASKVEVAKQYVASNTLHSAEDIENTLDLKTELNRLISFIRESNPSVMLQK